MQIMDVLLTAFLLSVVLVGIHAYFGRVIIQKGIVFTDLAVGQMAGTGLALSLLLSQESYTYSLTLLFALLGALFVYLSERLKAFQEAFIGLLYAFGISSTYLLLSKNPHGAEEFLKLSASDILFTPKAEVLKAGILYAFIGFLLYLSQKKLREPYKSITFYFLFALTLTSSVRLAGVLVVFALLLAPALVSLLFERKLLFAWLYGSILNAWAVIFSYLWDFPTGFSVVFWQALGAMLSFFFKILVKP
ncbi:metal ABC transporter permease [Hydrogenobacter hydrogenophilus]|uniref:Zinc/manganese transport system permease protein n=1 Tax=Hydrogenobacter hydrogenophilus TaxID=35835 RepID=A0A285P1F9_9AQUI|nr:metal ABC transporter permease [Hydrogenobacter hydrogenophilus]SNZ13711.1 zinc/manganese transport system permease protein [Hydrogenobacter hydrogenophilus]